MDINIQWFNTFEEREDYFQKQISNLIPPSYLGVKPFWQAFTAIGAKDVANYNAHKTACITAFPQDSLAFASPLQVLRAATMGRPQALTQEREAIATFKLGNLLNQALRTLSGGETVRLALAKAWLNAHTHNKLTIASPYSWLDAHNANLIENVAQTYLSQNKPVDFLALTGENADFATAATPAEFTPPHLAPLGFSITARNLRFKLSQSLSLGAPPLWAHAGSLDLQLASPCLVQGENGAGKSLLVKALAKVGGYKGVFYINNAKDRAPCRLIQQNTLSQSLLRIKNQFAPTSSGALLNEFMQLRRELQQATELRLQEEILAASLLDIKLALAAARLCQKPQMLILDEPEWGLSLTHALAFVYALCETAHAREIPIMLVSHKNWWQNLAKSHVHVSKSDTPDHMPPRTVFSMQVKAVAQ